MLATAPAVCVADERRRRARSGIGPQSVQTARMNVKGEFCASHRSAFGWQSVYALLNGLCGPQTQTPWVRCISRARAGALQVSPSNESLFKLSVLSFVPRVRTVGAVYEAVRSTCAANDSDCRRRRATT